MTCSVKDCPDKGKYPPDLAKAMTIKGGTFYCPKHAKQNMPAIRLAP